MTTPAVQPPPTGLVAAYAFDETAGTTAGDASGNTNTGTLQTGAGWTAAGHAGGALVLDGSSGRVRVPASSSLGLTSAMTLEAWIRPSVAQGGWRTILQRETDAYFLNASNDTGALRPSGGGTFGVTTAFVTGTTASPVGVWTHVALTYDGATLRLYVNGTLVTSAARTGTIQASPNPLWIGGNSPYGEFFAGSIDDARVYNRALSAAELATDMATPVGGGPPPDTTPPGAPASLTATASSADPGRSGLAGRDRQRGGHRLSPRALHRRRLHDLRRDRHADRSDRVRPRPDGLDHVPLPGPRQRCRGQPRRLLADRERDHPGRRRHDPARRAGQPDRDRELGAPRSIWPGRPRPTTWRSPAIASSAAPAPAARPSPRSPRRPV